MKKLIIALTVSTFALAGSLHAADTTPAPAKDKAACCDKAASSSKTATSACCDKKASSDKTMASACCDKAKAACCTDSKAAACDKSKMSASGSACCGGNKSACSKMISRRIAMSPRAAELAAR